MPQDRPPRTLGATQARNIKALQLRPQSGTGTATTIARGRTGSVACDITDGAYRIVSDLGAGQGGGDLGPDPGILMRAGLAACLVSGYQMWAAYLGITLDEVEVTIETDYDARGMYAVDAAIAPGFLGVRARVRITSGDPPDRIREMVEHADRHSPLLYDFTTALDVKREVEIAASGAKGG